jgi:hypothetical protein
MEKRKRALSQLLPGGVEEEEETSSHKGFSRIRIRFNTLLKHDESEKEKERERERERERNRLGMVYNDGGEMSEIALFQLLP